MKKYILKYIAISIITALAFSSCEEGTNMPFDGKLTEGVPLVALHMTDNSDSSPIDIKDLANLALEFETAIVYETATSVELVVALNGDFVETGILGTSTTIPSTFQVSGNDIIDALPSLSSFDDLASGDQLAFYLNVIGPDGTVYSGYTPTGDQAQPASQRSIPGHVFSHTFDCIAICAPVTDDLVGSWSGTDEFSGYDVTCNIEKVDESTIVIRANSGIPVFLEAVWLGWEEVYKTGIGNDGDVYVTFNGGYITVEHTYWGQTLASDGNSWDYWNSGVGYHSCDGELTIDFIMHFDATSTGGAATRLSITKN